MAKKARSKKGAPAKRPQPAKRPIAAGPAGPAADTGGPAQQDGSSKRSKTTQAERIEAARRARRRKKLQLRIALAALAAVVAGAVAVNALSNQSDTEAFRDKLTAGSCDFDTRNDPTAASPNNHVAPASYEVNPPAGGNHDPGPAPAGNYEQGAAPPDAKVVHSLEHGYIAVWYRPGIPQKEMDVITKVFERYENDVLVVPRPSMPPGTEVAATAWGERLLCKNAELGPLTDFVKRYRNEGPEKVPHT